VEKLKFEKHKELILSAYPSLTSDIVQHGLLNTVYKLLSPFAKQFGEGCDIIALQISTLKKAQLFRGDIKRANDDYEMAKGLLGYKQMMNSMSDTMVKIQEARLTLKERSELNDITPKINRAFQWLRGTLMLEEKEVVALRDAIDYDNIGKIRLAFNKAKTDLRKLFDKAGYTKEAGMSEKGGGYIAEAEVLKKRFPNITLDEADKIPVEEIFEQVRKESF